jgi:5-hydroxyisourate hydrolase
LSPITTHVLDTSLGRPAAGVSAVLERQAPNGSWSVLGQGVTDADGRIRDLLPGPLETGTFRLIFDTGAYFAAQGRTGFYPTVSIVFQIVDAGQHYHVPLLLSPFGYSTYRGS